MKIKEILEKDIDFYDFYNFIKGKFTIGDEKLIFTSAHNLNDGIDKSYDYESLLEHMNKVLNFFIRFSEKRNIKFILHKNENLNNKLIKNMLRVVFIHDIGKLNLEFQKKHYKFKDYNNTEHSKFSFYIGLVLFFDELKSLLNSKVYVSENKQTKKNLTEEYVEFFYFFLFLYIVTLHHSNLSKFDLVYEFGEGEKYLDFKEVVEKDLKYFLVDNEEIFLNIFKLFPNSDKLLKDFNSLKKMIEYEDFFIPDILFKKEKKHIFFQIKLFYSLLVLSDYYATFSYQYRKKIEDVKIRQIDKKLLTKIDENFHKLKYNKELKNIEKIELRELENCKTINDLRNNLLKQATKTLKENLDKNKVFMLNVPTGGGKTNISLKLGLEILKFDRKVNRLNWVFPYVNIIEQNTEVIKKSYFDNNGNLIKESLSQIYHDSIEIEDIEKFKNEKKFEKEKINLLEKELNLNFINNPINIISSVNFFDSIFKVKRNNRYKFANFVNSVIIIDEIQTIPIKNLDVFYQILETLSNQFNMYFVIMSATLPDINTLNAIKGNKSYAIDLIENYEKYFNHDVFKRNSIEFLEEKFDKEKLVDLTLRLTKNPNYNKILIVLNTIKSSVEIFQEIKQKKKNGWNVLILNSYITRHMKNKIINFIKSNNKIILVSTQSIEAGVDLDFDCAIRDYAIIDSIEQVSGRVNRECDKDKNEVSKIFIINYNGESKRIYKEDERFEILDKNQEKKCLERKDFKFYYNLVFKKRNKKQDSSILENSFKYIEELNFAKLSELEIIKKNISITLVFNEILDELKEEFKDKINEFEKMSDILGLKKGKEKSFENKALFSFVNKFISKNSVQISFYSLNDKLQFIDFLKEKTFLLENEYSNNGGKNLFIVDNKFYEIYYGDCDIGKEKFKFFNVSKLKEEFKKFKKNVSGIFI
jgi:CRISPR-associated endonuclease/helicase Cas3